VGLDLLIISVILSAELKFLLIPPNDGILERVLAKEAASSFVILVELVELARAIRIVMSGRNLVNIEDVDLLTTVAGVARGVVDEICNDSASEWSDSASEWNDSASDHLLDFADKSPVLCAEVLCAGVLCADS
jgi:hypothetical protein